MAPRCLILTLLLPILLAVLPVQGAEKEQAFQKPREFIHTFLGPAIEGGYNRVAYREWRVTSMTTQTLQGFFGGGGVIMGLYAGYLGGEFIIAFHYNMMNPALWHMGYSLMGKGLIPIGTSFNVTIGLGLYLESPPANRSYKGGAGFKGSLGTIIHTSYDTRLVIDGYARYGWYDLGEDSRKISAGFSVGFLFKVGRL